MGTVVRLPEFPKDKEFEEYIASVLHSCRPCFIERNLVDKEVDEILELDIIYYSFNYDKAPDVYLVEIKSGDWGFPEIFKIRGWMHYLNFSNGI